MVKTKDGLKSQFELMKPEDRIELTRQMRQWDASPGKYIYTPNPKEAWYALQPHTIKGISAGNRAGKTGTHSQDLVSQAEGWHPLQRNNLIKLSKEAISKEVREHCERLLDEQKWIPDPPIEARCISVDYGFVERVNGPEFVKWATKSELKYVGYDNEKKRRIDWKNGSYIEFMTHAQELDTHGGASRHVIMFDEEAPKNIWDESLMRIIDVNGRILYGCTGVEGVTWSDESIWIPGLRGEDPDIYVIEMSTYDNPTITNEMIDKIKAQCKTQQEIDIRIYGKRVRRGGNVYDMARDEYPWVIPSFTPPKDGVLILAADIHPKTEQALLWVWVDFKGEVELGNGDKSMPLREEEKKPNLYEVAEVFQHANVIQMDHLIKETEKLLGRTHDDFLLELAAWNDDQNSSSKNVAHQFQDLGYDPIKASKELTGGILEVKSLLTVEDFVKNETHDFPRLMTCEHLERLRWERKNYHYPTQIKGRNIEDMPIKQKPVDKDDHIMEDERRIVQFVVDHEMELMQVEDDNSFKMPDGSIITFDQEDNFDAIIGE